EAASIVEDRLREPGSAAERFARAYDLAPEEHDVATHARSLYLSVGDRAAALALLDHEIASTPESDRGPLRVLRAEMQPEAASPAPPSPPPRRPRLPPARRA